MSDEKRNFYFIQDGGPRFGYGCGLKGCTSVPVGNFLVIDDETSQEMTAVDLCGEHAQKLATGYVSCAR